MGHNRKIAGWATLIRSFIVLSLFPLIVAVDTLVTQDSKSSSTVNVTATTHYTSIEIKNSLPVSLKNIRFAHISNQELNVQTWDNVESGETLPPVPIKYATGIGTGSDKWNLDITFEDGETFYIDRDSVCNLEDDDSNQLYTWTIKGYNFEMPMNSDGMTTQINNNDGDEGFNDYAFARIKNEYDQTLEWSQLAHTHEGTDERTSSWTLSIPPQEYSPIVPVYFTTGFGNTNTDYWAIRAEYTTEDGTQYLLRQSEEHYKCMLKSGDAGRLFHIGIRGQHDKSGDFIIDIPSGSCTVDLVQSRENGWTGDMEL